MNKKLTRYARWLLMILFLSLSVACLPCRRAPERDFTTESLLMENSMFPPGWNNGGPVIPTADSHGAIEHLLRGVSGKHVMGVAVHEIYRYECVNDARREYKRQLDVWFPDTPLYDEWRPQEDLHTAFVFAGEAYVACANRGRPLEEKIMNCRMLARYHEYVVRFSTQVVPPYLTFEDLVKILKTIDNKFASAMRSQ